MEVIKSNKNTKIKEWIKLKAAKGRKKARQYMIEGEHLVEEAINHHADIDKVVVTDEKLDQYRSLLFPYESDMVVVNDSVMKSLCETQANQGIAAIINMPDRSSEVKEFDGKVLLVDAVQDPGNLGTIIRTADAAGFSAVVLGEGTVDLYNDKVLRSMQGSNYHLPIVHANLVEWITTYQEKGLPVFAAALDEQAKDYQVIAGIENQAIIVGNEGQGINPDILSITKNKIMIPIYGEAESLNVSIAASLLMYKAQEKKG
ncbi:RNA methyltransferase, TrmH family [Granulicatella balaenopterae]|uniref:RNA methyltransferase, TrmH family n=1 Tax=Granulicatella balaenopterae TaxID=137733 RepID=A0A1H9KT94_9LACT|nr:RNA methyltransferase [Granulicatella balaenopterae]SER02414.1 RNA methyltransferase, TrmH family [Granulicatella balaenopterae]